jgi:hypothetical protein
MCKNCGCKESGKKIKYECDCPDEKCSCGFIEFDEEPNSIPYCCGIPMKKIN